MHLDDDIIDQYAMAKLGETATAEAEDHLVVCALCRRELQATELIIDALQYAAYAQAWAQRN